VSVGSAAAGTCSAMRIEAAALPPSARMAVEIWPSPLAVASALRKIASASPAAIPMRMAQAEKLRSQRVETFECFGSHS